MNRPATPAGPYLSELADGVFGYVQPPGGWCVSNAGVITGGQSVVLVDTLATTARTAALRSVVAGLCRGPVRTVVNTHFHGDHTFGNSQFPDATFIGHRLLRTSMTTAGTALTQLWPEVDWGEIEIMPPAIVFDDRLTLYAGERELQLIHFGPAYTTNDVVVWLPAERVLFAGDIVLSGCTPFVLMGSVRGSLAAIEQMAGLNPDVILCGHGAPAGPDVFEANARYLRWLTDIAGQGIDARLTPLQLAREIELGEFAELLDAERLVANLRRAYAELGGAAPGVELDVMAAFAEMVELTGGLPVCAA
jgi:cyclase